MTMRWCNTPLSLLRSWSLAILVSEARRSRSDTRNNRSCGRSLLFQVMRTERRGEGMRGRVRIWLPNMQAVWAEEGMYCMYKDKIDIESKSQVYFFEFCHWEQVSLVRVNCLWTLSRNKRSTVSVNPFHRFTSLSLWFNQFSLCWWQQKISRVYVDTSCHLSF